MSDEVTFSGFTEQALKFLKAVGFHQNREWYHENKALYEKIVKQPMGDLIEAASSRLAEMEIPLHGSRKTSMFKINRDVRFSKNKDPYNTHVSAVLTRNGTKKDNTGGYLHFKPDNCFIAAGVWELDGTSLRALREMIIARSGEFLAIEKALNEKGLFFTTENSLKRVPPAFKHIEDEQIQRLLKQRSFIVELPLKDEAIQSADLVDTFTQLVKDALPLMKFCWRAIDPVRDLNDG